MVHKGGYGKKKTPSEQTVTAPKAEAPPQSYSKTAKFENVEGPGGKQYPVNKTLAPDFKPNPNPSYKLDFKPDGTVVEDDNGVTNIYTKQQYNQSQNATTAGETSQEKFDRMGMQAEGGILKPKQQLGFIPPEPLGEDTQPAGLDLLDASQIAAGATTGGALGAKIGAVGGSVIPGVGTAVGAGVVGTLGAIAGAAGAFFYSSAGERKQQTKVSFNKFADATEQMDNIIKDVNSRHYSNQQASANWDNEYARVLQSERELIAQQDAFFGEKLSKSRDELEKVIAWKRRYAQFNFDFEQAKANPDPSRITTSIAVQPDITP